MSNYTIISDAKVIYQSITHEFTIQDGDGKIYELRKWEDDNGGGFLIKEDVLNWVDFYPDEEMEEWILEEINF